MNSHELRTHKANLKKVEIIAHLKEVGPMKQRDIAAMFDCGRALAKKAMEEAGYSGLKARDYLEPKKDILDTGLFRPGGVNYLTVKWS